MATIDNLSIQVTTSADSAASALNRLASSASGLRGAVQAAAGGMQSAAQGAQDMGSSTAQAGEQTEKARKSLHGFWNALKQSGSYLGGAFLGGMKGIVSALGSMASGLLRIAKFRIYRTIVKDLGQSFKDLYGWSKMFGSEYANSMDRINSSFVYLRNSIASAAAPLFNALAPVLDAIIDKIVTLLNWLNQLFSALSGASTYTVAKKVEQSWGSTFTNTSNNAKKTADDIKRTILGFDEINKLSKDKDSSSGGGGGSSPYTSGYQYMFEEKELAGGWKDFATAIENAMSDAFSRITMIVGGAELALGAILALSGANVPLGLGLMATGAVTLGSAIFANWEGISKEVKLAVAGVEAAVAGGLAVGAVLAFSGGNVGLGIGLMIAALSTSMGAATIAWNTIGDTMSEKVQAIATLVGGASFGIGAVLAFAGHPGIGIAMMIAGASVTAVSINWNFLKEKLEGPIGAVTTLISGASLALGILALLGGNIPIGLGLILAGTAGLATTVAANWDNVVGIGKTFIEKVKEGMTAAVGGIANFIKTYIINPIVKAWNWLLGIFGGGNDNEEGSGVTSNAAISPGLASNASVGDSVAQEADQETINKLNNIGRTMGEAINKGILDAVNGVVNRVWDTITQTWNAETRELPVTVNVQGSDGNTINISPILDATGADLWNALKTEWDAIGNKKLFFDIATNQNANGLWKGLETSWAALGNKKLYFDVGMNQNANGLWKGLETSWEALGNKKLYFDVAMNQNANGLWKGLETAWEALGLKKLFFDIAANQNANGLWEGLETAWKALGAKKLYFDVGMNQNANGLWEGLETAWKALGLKKLYFDVGMNQNANGLWEGLKTAWDALVDKTLKVNVELDYNGIDGFGGATGGGGSTSGGGAGRSIKINVEPETTVGGKTFWERAKEAIDATGTAIDKGLDVIVRPALNSAGDKITSIVKWLFGNDNTPDVTTKVNASAGTGFSGVSGSTFTIGGVNDTSAKVNGVAGAGFSGVQATGNCFTLNPIAPAGVTVNGTPGTGFGNNLSGSHKYTLAGIEDANAKVNATVGYGENTDNKSVLGLFDWTKNVLATGAARSGEGVTNESVLGLFDWTKNVLAVGAARSGENTKKTSVLDLFTWSSKVKADGAELDTDAGVKKNAVTKLFTWVKKVVANGAERYKKTGDDAVTKLFKWTKKVTASGASKGDLKDSAVLDLFDWAKTITITAIEFGKGVLDKIKEKIKSAIDSATKGAGAASGGVIQNGRLTRFESGGIINNGFVRKLPHYAGGTTDAHGTLFVAGEAGPEILGHIGGRTEILNQSQLAATMFAAVRSAMGGVKIAATMYDGGADSDEADYEMMYRAMYDAFTDAMAPNAERDREKVQLMRQIAAKEFTAEVTANSVNRAQTRMNRRAGTTIVPVGT